MTASAVSNRRSSCNLIKQILNIVLQTAGAQFNLTFNRQLSFDALLAANWIIEGARYDVTHILVQSHLVEILWQANNFVVLP